jgi:hypothetical protein
MKVGDKVRLLHGKEEGIVSKILDNQLVEVEIEDGFGIPVMKSELVIIAAEESASFDRQSQQPVQQTKKPEPKKSTSQQHVAIAVVALNDHLRSFYLLNDTADVVIFCINEVDGVNERTLRMDKVQAGGHVKFTEQSFAELDKWNALSITFIRASSKWAIPPAIKNFHLKFKAKQFTKEPQLIEALGKPGHLFPLNQESGKEKSVTLDAEQLKEGMFRSSNEVDNKNITSKGQTTEIDLHIEEINENYSQLPKEEILRIQLETFEKKLDEAIVAGINEITFIHGVGNGTLRNHIHKRLSQMENIQYFKDAKKEKFGYGATLIRIN